MASMASLRGVGRARRLFGRFGPDESDGIGQRDERDEEESGRGEGTCGGRGCMVCYVHSMYIKEMCRCQEPC